MLKYSSYVSTTRFAPYEMHTETRKATNIVFVYQMYLPETELKYISIKFVAI